MRVKPGQFLKATLTSISNKPRLSGFDTIPSQKAHLMAVMLEENKPSYPFLSLIVSGGHTLLLQVNAFGDYQLLGESLDDAVGEAFDKTATLLGLSYPGGPTLAKLAEQGRSDRFKFPLINVKDIDQFQRFLYLCAARVGRLLDYTSFANDLGISRHTVKEWISVLLDIITPHGGELIAIEIKSSETFHKDVLKPLKKMENLAKAKKIKSFLVYAGTQEQDVQNIKLINYQNIAGLEEWV